MNFHNLLIVPLIFIMDELFKSSFGLPELVDIMFPVNSTINQIEIGQSTQYYAAFIKIIVSCLSKFNKLIKKNNTTTVPVNLIKFFIILVFCSSFYLLTLPAICLIPVYLYVVSICVILVSYWENMETLLFLSGKYKNFKIETTNELITWDVYEYMIIFIQLYPRLYKLSQSIIIQYCLSLAFDILQVFTTGHSIHKVNIKFN